VSAAIERMQASNPAINAVTLDLSEQALADAARADDARSAGERCGPLHGVPITIKENADQEGLPNPNGVAAFKDLIAPGDASVVVNLKKAGAIVIGRTNTPEFSLRYFTDNPLRGLTHNPWKEGITPGGSSGGAAASVAMGIGDIAHGNDLGGSLRYPAYACGVATIRPSLGRVPAYNPSSAEERPPSFQLMSVQGPIARQVEDVRLALSVMAAGDPRDPWWVPAPLEGPDPSAPVGVAVVKAPAGLACAAPVAQAIDSAAAHLRRSSPLTSPRSRLVGATSCSPMSRRCWHRSCASTDRPTLAASTIAIAAMPSSSTWRATFALCRRAPGTCVTGRSSWSASPWSWHRCPWCRRCRRART
jgi:amidase